MGNNAGVSVLSLREEFQENPRAIEEGEIAARNEYLANQASIALAAGQTRFRKPDEVIDPVDCEDCGHEIDIERLKIVHTTRCSSCADLRDKRSKQFRR